MPNKRISGIVEATGKDQIRYYRIKHPKYKYELAEEYRLLLPKQFWPKERIETEYVILETDGWLTIKPGYHWDGCSGPTIDTNGKNKVLKFIPAGSTMRGGLFHDVGYQLCRMKKFVFKMVKAIDKYFRIILLEDGVSRARARLYFIGVYNWFVHRFAKPRN